MKYLDKRNGEGWKEKFSDAFKRLEDEFYNSEPEK